MRRRLVLVVSSLAACSSSPGSHQKSAHDRSAARVASIAGPMSHTDIQYDASGTRFVGQTFTTDAGHQLSSIDYAYDGDRIAQETFTAVIDGSPVTTTRSYQYDGELLASVSVAIDHAAPSGWTYSYDPMGQVTSTTDTQGGVSTYDYDDMGRLAAIRGSSGTWTFGYDSSNRLAQLHDGPGDDYSLTYDGQDRVLMVTSAQGHRFDFEYDNKGRLTTLTSNLGTTPVAFHYAYLDGSVVNMSLKTALSGNYELQNYVDLEGRTFDHPDPLQLIPDL
jgi:YD repeat-containing protein